MIPLFKIQKQTNQTMAKEVRIMLILEAQRAETGRERERKGGLWDVDSVQFVKIYQALNLHFVHFSVHMLYFNIKFPNNFVFVV